MPYLASLIASRSYEQDPEGRYGSGSCSDPLPGSELQRLLDCVRQFMSGRTGLTLKNAGSWPDISAPLRNCVW